MRLTPALAYEKLRQDADSMNKIILNKDGKWYHVYEWSAWLLSLVPEIRTFLKDRLHMELHMGKLHITRARQGAEFLGGYVKPHTTYISRESLRRMKASVDDINTRHPQQTWASVCSFLGVLSHYDSYNIRSRMFFNSELLKLGTFNREMTQFTLRQERLRVSESNHACMNCRA